MATPGASPRRCEWAQKDPLLAAYHDDEWGVPVRDDRKWFEKLLLDGAQAGLSWLTILKRREGYRLAFRDFDYTKVARFGARDVERLMRDPGIIRNRLKVQSAIDNARAFLAVREEFGSFDAFVWGQVGGRPLQGSVREGDTWPARTELSDALSKELKRYGFSFVGSTIVYALMQASGLVNDHRHECFRREPVERLGAAMQALAPSAARVTHGRGPRD
jgi:DNA-3-methyladenine glycosylase I